MEFITHTRGDHKIAEIIADSLFINTAEAGTDLLGNIYYSGFDKVILPATCLSADFFDLKTKMAGEILQKFSTYRVRLVIVGDFSNYTGKSIRDFIYESNNGKQVNFLSTVDEALDALHAY